MQEPGPLSLSLTQKQFEIISGMVYRICGIDLHMGKEELVKARLGKRLRSLGFDSFDRYISYLEQDKSGREIINMMESLTTNKTSFFRESQHFDYMRNQILPALISARSRIRIWSAGCSSGEEPYTISIVLLESTPGINAMDVKVLATDIATAVLKKAKEGIYEAESVRDINPQLLKKYFEIVKDGGTKYKVKDSVKQLVTFARLNLMESWPMKGPFDIIFCRNVMIYFDKPTQERLVNRYYDYLKPGGHLFVGHSESLVSIDHKFHYVQPAIYKK